MALGLVMHLRKYLNKYACLKSFLGLCSAKRGNKCWFGRFLGLLATVLFVVSGVLQYQSIAFKLCH